MDDETMSEKRGGSITEEDVSVIFQRYTAATVITLLQEVAQVPDVKIDWDALVKQTKTGITNPREYQMLWRHLAYRDPLIEKFEDNVEPLDDDSDLEYELEAFPPVSNEASAEAAACVKVHIASGSASKSCIERGLTVEAPLTINIPRVKSLNDTHVSSSINITVPVSVPTLTVSSAAEGFDTTLCVNNNNNNLPPRRKRKPWSAAEDDQLFAAVHKFGEGNWANIVKAEFMPDRTASQLSQRWSIIKKRQTNPITKGSMEVQLAARRALNMALDKPKLPCSLAESVELKRGFARNEVVQDAVKAAAVAAGARIATQSAAAEILKAQLKSAIHIRAGEYLRPNAPRGASHASVVKPLVEPIQQDQVVMN